MLGKLKTINSFTLAMALVLALGGVAYGLTQVARNVSATVDVQISAPSGIEIYLDAARTLPASNISFGTVVVDPFGTPADQEANRVPVWVENQSNSSIQLTLTDDFALGDVVLAGSSPAPTLQPGEVLPAELLLNFHQGVAGTHPFNITFQAEGPVPGQSEIVLVTAEEPQSLGVWSPECGLTRVSHMVCQQLTTDPLTWFDTSFRQPTLLSGINSWESLAPDRWRFILRPGVIFHNGERWNATAAKLGLDLTGDPNNGLAGYSLHGDIHGEVVDDLTVDVVCASACLIFPSTAMFTSFQARQWWASEGQADPTATTMGFGPYEVVEWRHGIDITLQAFSGYKPSSSADSHSPMINDVRQIWRGEQLVRAAMIATGEADWAEAIGSQNINRVPKAISGGTDEVFMLVADNIWHPELSKKDVRRALAHSIDCDAIMQALYNGLITCFGNISPAGTTGITPHNSTPYTYDPDLSRQLLTNAAYDPANDIQIYARSDRGYRNIELWEGVVNYWREAGVNAGLTILDPTTASEYRQSGCGRLVDPLTCPTSQPPAPIFASSHYYETAASNATFDFQRQALQFMSCFNVNSRVCDPSAGGLEEKIQLAVDTSLGDLRKQRMEELANIAHDEYYFLPMFEVRSVFGMADNLMWQPRHDNRVRVNTMSFGR